MDSPGTKTVQYNRAEAAMNQQSTSDRQRTTSRPTSYKRAQRLTKRPTVVTGTGDAEQSSLATEVTESALANGAAAQVTAEEQPVAKSANGRKAHPKFFSD